jgi:hypothetical protein
MEKKLQVVELAIVIAIPNYDPTLLNPSFLSMSGIVKGEWEIAQQPVVSQRASQIIYNNGISLVAQPGRLILVEALGTKEDSSINISSIARRYLESLPNLDAQAIGINFRGFVPFADVESGARDYLFKTLLAPGEWQSIGSAPVQAALNFMYTFDSKRLNLNLTEAALQMPESEKVSIIMWGGNFDYELTDESMSERRNKLISIVNNWQSDKEVYTEVVNKFVDSKNESELVFPAFATLS